MRYYTDSQILMDDIRGGRSEAFEYLFKTYYPRLRNYASHFIADIDDAEDILQDCFTRLWERRETLTYISLSALLFTMVRNGCLNYLKHKSLVNNYEVDFLAHMSGSEQLYNYDFLDKTDAPLLYEELRRQIEKVMETLPPRSRQIFEMSRFEGLKNREIAAELGISVKVVEKHISKALSAFKTHFKKGVATESQYLLLAWLYTMM
ncbi:RNA polymerase sigma-70 factor [Prevotella sp. KH2C16]|uniref:RNA polymerase sigma-70 factor n=1 Tax=Prevotella sp. KH2C16 TaxID=1855325 RepID=UPI0008F2D421|nr:RNA polymerase sigma-70 factor [Prevotella sp. KH2C16]SFG03196.1 RNA polymerase sigma-70 factor, ECF subfamily [Prevotella sp. KH2C16]